MPRQPVPIVDLDRRLPEAGRIRIGVKQGRRPSKLDTFRFTSADREAIEQVAEVYGGQPRPWAEFAGRWEVITPAKMIKIALPPDPLGGTPIYELWARGGCQRRCNGVRVFVMTGSGPDGAEPYEDDCLCNRRGELACKLTTRLHVLLPEIKFAGVWGLVSGSWAVAHEMPGMVELISEMQQKGIQRAELRLEQRPGPKGPVFIPALGFAETLDALASGGSRVAALPAGGEHQYEALTGAHDTDAGDAWPERELTPLDGPAYFETAKPDIVDAEIVEEPTQGPPLAMSAYHEDPALVQAWKDALTTTQQNKVLRMARDRHDCPDEGPRTFDEVSPEFIGEMIERGYPATGE